MCFARTMKFARKLGRLGSKGNVGNIYSYQSLQLQTVITYGQRMVVPVLANTNRMCTLCIVISAFFVRDVLRTKHVSVINIMLSCLEFQITNTLLKDSFRHRNQAFELTIKYSMAIRVIYTIG